MFKIKKILLDNVDTLIFNDDSTLVYGPNNVGKSVLFKILYFMLGSEKGYDEKLVWNLQGLDNVYSITLVVDNNEKVYFMRNKSNECYYKLSDSDNYMIIDLSLYKEKIQSMLIANNDCFELYKKVVDEKLTYRAFSYLNFIDQYALGNVIDLFPNDFRYARRIRRQMQFLFDSEKLIELSNLEKERDEKNRQLDEMLNSVQKRDFISKEIFTLMAKLNLQVSDFMNDNKRIFSEFLKGEKNSVEQPVNKELNYLLKVSNQLNNQIQIERTFSKQRDLMWSRNQKNSTLLQLLKNSIEKNEEYQKYYNSIEKTLGELKTEKDILSMKDYESSINKIIIKKKEIDLLIEKTMNSLSERNEYETGRIVDQLKYLFSEFDKIVINDNYDSLLEAKKKLDFEIKAKKKLIGASKSHKLNKFLTKYYLNMPKELSFVDEDLKRRDFSLEFIPMKMETIGIEKEIIGSEEEYVRSVEFIPGSKARQACWQIITFIGLHLFIKDEFPSLPLIPVIIVDGINEPFDKNFDIAYKYLSDLCNAKGIQFISMSTVKLDLNILDISKGLNSRHSQNE